MLLLPPPQFSTRLHCHRHHSDAAISPETRRHDFTPLLNYLSSKSSTLTSPISHSSPPSRLDPDEFHLAETYRAVPAHHWHSLLKTLSKSRDSLSTATALVPWLQRHNMCYSIDLLYSILIHALGRSKQLYQAFLLSNQVSDIRN